MNKRSDFLNWISCIATILVGADIIHILKSPVHFNDCMLTQFATLSLWITAMTIMQRVLKAYINHRKENFTSKEESENSMN